jgi:hypothetical protein
VGILLVLSPSSSSAAAVVVVLSAVFREMAAAEADSARPTPRARDGATLMMIILELGTTTTCWNLEQLTDWWWRVETGTISLQTPDGRRQCGPLEIMHLCSSHADASRMWHTRNSLSYFTHCWLAILLAAIEAAATSRLGYSTY